MLKFAPPPSLPIARPPWTTLGKKLESQCRKAIFEFHLLDQVSSVAVALSGGKDSLTLLYLLHAISGRGIPPLKIYAIHVDGAFSCGGSVQYNFLKGICDELNIELLTRTATQKRETLQCYSCSRERRRLIFEAAKSVDATTVAFGHHREDHAQTLLLNLFHKGEFAGMLPKLEMLSYGITIIRPLIYISEQDIVHFAQNYGFARITCQCPVGQVSMRKKVSQLLGELEELFPNVRANVAQGGLLYGSDKARIKI